MYFYKLVNDDLFPLYFQGLENAKKRSYEMSGLNFEWEYKVYAGEGVYKSKLKSVKHENTSRFEIWVIFMEDAQKPTKTITEIKTTTNKDKLLRVATQLLAADMSAYKGNVQNSAGGYGSYHASDTTIHSMIDMATRLINAVDEKSET